MKWVPDRILGVPGRAAKAGGLIGVVAVTALVGLAADRRAVDRSVPNWAEIGLDQAAGAASAAPSGLGEPVTAEVAAAAAASAAERAAAEARAVAGLSAAWSDIRATARDTAAAAGRVAAAADDLTAAARRLTAETACNRTRVAAERAAAEARAAAGLSAAWSDTRATARNAAAAAGRVAAAADDLAAAARRLTAEVAHNHTRAAEARTIAGLAAVWSEARAAAAAAQQLAAEVADSYAREQTRQIALALVTYHALGTIQPVPQQLKYPLLPKPGKSATTASWKATLAGNWKDPSAVKIVEKAKTALNDAGITFSVDGVSYDPDTLTLTWTLPRPTGATTEKGLQDLLRPVINDVLDQSQYEGAERDQIVSNFRVKFKPPEGNQGGQNDSGSQPPALQPIPGSTVSCGPCWTPAVYLPCSTLSYSSCCTKTACGVCRTGCCNLIGRRCR